jgi:hypothetical protein
MAIFTVHTPAAEPDASDKFVFLRDGFSIPAFVFGPLWLLWNRAFLAAGAWLGLLAVLGLFGRTLGVGLESLWFVNVALSLALAFEGSEVLAWSLARRGYCASGVVMGETATEAEDYFFHHWRAGTPAAATKDPA